MTQYDPNMGDIVVHTETDMVGRILVEDYRNGYEIGRHRPEDNAAPYVRVGFGYHPVDPRWIKVVELLPLATIDDIGVLRPYQNDTHVRTAVRKEDPENDGEDLSNMCDVSLSLWIDMADLLGQAGLGIASEIVLSRVTAMSYGEGELFITSRGEMSRYPVEDIKSMNIRPSKAEHADQTLAERSRNVPRVVDERTENA
jgi:hypothetical protein